MPISIGQHHKKTCRKTEANVTSYYGNPVERVSEFKYLGIIISEDLSWSKQVAVVVTRSWKILGVIFRIFYPWCDTSTLLKLYIGYVKLHLQYCSFVWDPPLLKDHMHNIDSLFSKLCHLYKIQNHLTAFPNSILEDMPAPPMQLRNHHTTHYLCHMLELTTSNIHSYQVYMQVLEHPPF